MGPGLAFAGEGVALHRIHGGGYWSEVRVGHGLDEGKRGFAAAPGSPTLTRLASDRLAAVR